MGLRLRWLQRGRPQRCSLHLPLHSQSSRYLPVELLAQHSPPPRGLSRAAWRLWQLQQGVKV